MSITQPLTPDHLVKINQSLAQLKDVAIGIDMAQRAGIDVSPQAKLMEEARKQLLALKSVYFPNS